MPKDKYLISPIAACDARDRSPKNFREWIDFVQKNKPQTNALAAGVMMMVYGGSQIGFGIFNNHIEVQPWAGGYEDTGTIFWTIVSFFIALLPGLIFGSISHNQFSKLQIYTFTSLLSIVSASVLILGSTSTYLITFSRSIGGFSHGIAYLTVLIHASEVAIPKLRGMVVGSIHFCLMIGIFISSSSMMPVYSIRNYKIDPTQTIGYNGLICILTGLILAVIFNRESPVFLMKKQRDDEALETIIRLRSESHETITIRHDFNEFRLMINEDVEFSSNILRYWMQFLIVIFFKIIYVGSFNMTINNYFLDLAKLNFYDATNDYTGMYLIGTRCGIMMIAMFMMDFKRIQLFLTSSIGCGAIFIYLAINPITDESSALIALSFQFLAGIAVGIVADIYTVDSVNTKIKPFFIAVTSIVENLLQIFLIVNFLYLKLTMSSLMTVFGAFMILAIIARPFNNYVSIIPDTSQLSLRYARNTFLYGP